MTKAEVAGAGVLLTPSRVACGAAVMAWVLVTRQVRALERRAEAIARKAELARREADRRFRALEAEFAASTAVAGGAAVVATAAADVTTLCSARDAVRELIREAEYVGRAFRPDAPPTQ